MNVAIITAYQSETREQIERCISSVRDQTLPATHILIADGSPQDWIGTVPDVRHIRLDKAHNDNGGTARSICAMIAAGENFDAIGFLDPNHWLDPMHVETCVDVAEREYQLHFVLAGVQLPDGTEREEMDANNLFMLRRGFPELTRWALITAQLARIGDQLLYENLRIKEYHGVETGPPTVKSYEDPRYTQTKKTEAADWFSRLSVRQQTVTSRRIGGSLQTDSYARK